MPFYDFDDLQHYRQQQQQEKEKVSPWAILDPSLQQKQSLFWNPSSTTTTTTKKKTYLDCPIEFITSQQQQLKHIQKENISSFDPEVTTTEKEKQEKKEIIKLQDYLKEIEEIETELLYHRNNIYSAKLKVLQDELLSIEQDTNKYILKQDKKFGRKRDKEIEAKEAMYHYELAAIDKQAEHERQKIYKDIEEKAGFARRVLTSEGGSLYNAATGNNASPTNSKKRKEKSPSSSDTIHSEDETNFSADEDQQPLNGFKRIHLKKKIGKLQAIHDRQRAVKSNKNKQNLEDALNIQDEDELDNDLALIKKSISSSSTTANGS